MNILLCTLGQTWAVIPESFALLDPGRCPLYEEHPERSVIVALREQHDLRPVDELWVCTTDAPDLDTGLERLYRWRGLVAPGLSLRIWRTAEVRDVEDQAAGEQVRELIYRAVLLAAEKIGEGGRLYLSLAGGRKTMSADLQRAGMVIGCDALLHVIAPPFGKMSDRMREAEPETFKAPLTDRDCDGLLPLVVGRGMRSELLEIRTETGEPIRTSTYPLPMPGDGVALEWNWDDGVSLPDEIERRERAGSRLLGNYLRQLAEEEHHANWRSLYRLSPAVIEHLRTAEIGKEDEDWLRRLPKADLHRHFGGAIGLPAQRRVAEAVWEALTRAQRKQALEVVAPLLDAREWSWDWPDRLRRHGERSHNVAALLLQASWEQLEHNLYEVTEPRYALKNSPHGFSAYERPGELTGSAILLHPAAWEHYAREALEQAREEGLRYLELRGSPQKYATGLEERLAFLETLDRVFREEEELRVRFVFIADRRQPGAFSEVVELVCRACREFPELVAGVDIAGDEAGGMEARAMAAELEEAYRHCIPVTIHAGEGEDAERIWEAAYHLHADRIGHGLTLLDHPELLARFRDRGLALELCPTSNREVVGFRDPEVPQSLEDREYPLREYWKRGLALTLCTDNPGISRTTIAREYLTAARMCGGISRWDALAMIRQGFIHAFLTAQEREALLKETDADIYRLLTPAD